MSLGRRDLTRYGWSLCLLAALLFCAACSESSDDEPSPPAATEVATATPATSSSTESEPPVLDEPSDTRRVITALRQQLEMIGVSDVEVFERFGSVIRIGGSLGPDMPTVQVYNKNSGFGRPIGSQRDIDAGGVPARLARTVVGMPPIPFVVFTCQGLQYEVTYSVGVDGQASVSGGEDLLAFASDLAPAVCNEPRLSLD